ncbi:ENTH domain-containing protein [Trichonephila clavipes]|uniref:ENTH domain-containing protein n=1 Tax=Trichonephila clavipes TaxID=2585209 RepID=A0A8X7BCS4_TRICX|nr:ENTH domain-containing protein [Trichonephila clavipes]
MSNSVVLKNRKASYDKIKIRRWILTAVSNVKSKIGVTIHHIRKFLEAKKNGLSTKPETKLILKRLLDTGHLRKMEGKYSISRRKSRSFAKNKGSAPKSAKRKVMKKSGLKKTVRSSSKSRSS